MQDAIDTHLETARDSPYSRDRKEAIEALAEMYPSADERDNRRVLETLRTVATDSTGRDERELAREALVECYETDPEAAAPVVVPAFCSLAEDAKLSEERLAAIDTLRRLYPDAGETERERIGETLAAVAGDGTYEDERTRARQRLRDITDENRSESGTGGRATGGEDGAESVGYLGVSLAEHLASAAEESPDACRERATELRDFLADNPVPDSAYEEVSEAVADLVQQLEVVPTDGDLDDDRKERVRRIATRVERLYERSG